MTVGSRLSSRLVIAGTHSGCGKTTIATGIMAALTRRGMKVAPAKVGPDYIDPGYHALATGRPGRNLDEWICGTEAMAPLANRAALGADMLVVEGVMGLFDGAPGGPDASTASVAQQLAAPVILVVDAASIGRSVTALVDGYRRHLQDRFSTGITAVILNRVGSDHHEAILRGALEPMGVPIVGTLRRDDRLVWRDRHLGLVPVVEQPGEVARSLDVLAEEVARQIDLEAVIRLARAAPPLFGAPLPEGARSGHCRIAVARGSAFSFYYPDNLERLAESGAELVDVDPLIDEALPEGTTGLVAGGGFPEAYAPKLSANELLCSEVRHAFSTGRLAIWAECGGLSWLSRTLDGHPMCGVIGTDVFMGDRVVLGYREARSRTDSPVSGSGNVLRGHEFHYSTSDPIGDALDITGWQGARRSGFAGPALFASYLHQHLGWHPGPAERFVEVCANLA